MADKRCPMCGNSNPEHAETCEHCNARLQPMWESGTPDSDGDNDWLNSFRDETGGDDELPAWLSDAVDDEPGAESADDWLARLGEGVGEETPSEKSDLGFLDDVGETEEDGLPEWFERDQYTPQTGALASSSMSYMQDDDDDQIIPDDSGTNWLERETRDGQPRSPIKKNPSGWLETYTDDEPDIEPGEIPDWLKSKAPAGFGEPEVEDNDVPDWLDSFASVDGPDQDLDDDGTPDWLQGDEPDRSATPPLPTAEDISSDEDVPDWLDTFAEEEPDVELADIPDWLMGSAPREELTPDPQPQANEGADDWLSLDEETAGEETGMGTDSFPDWLAGMDETPSETAAPDPTPDDSIDELDWLAPADPEPVDIFGETQDDTAFGAVIDELPDSAAFDDDADDDIPEWLEESILGDQESPDLTDFTPEAPSFPSASAEVETQSDMPDWLSKFSGIEGEEPEDDVPDWMKAKDTEIDFADDGGFDWMSDMQQGASSSGAVPSVGAFGSLSEDDEAEITGEADMPDWLADIQGQGTTLPVEPAMGEQIPSAFSGGSSFDTDEETFPDFLDGGNNLDWMSEVDAQPESDGDASIPVNEDMPDWLEAMRPVQGASVASEMTDGEVETVGPLSGLRALLPAEPAVARSGKPGAYSVKLQVTENQQEKIDLLNQMIGAETETVPLSQPTLLSPQHLLRLLIALLLSIAIIWSLTVELVPLPRAIPPEVQAVSQTIIALPQDAQVLVAFDYEPGLSGEMDAAADAVIDHLIRQGTRLALVSTSPVGPALGERFMQLLQAEHTTIKQYVNLGYISGGASGLQSFAISPKSTVIMPYDDRFILDLLDFEANNVWLSPVLADINAVDDFDMALVITDDPDTARTWIEQVKPRMGANPMLMVISAQAEPLVRPYFESEQRQVSGMVTGLAGGASYEALQGRQQQARLYWNPYGLSLLLAIALIFIGGAYNLLIGRRQQRKERGQG